MCYLVRHEPDSTQLERRTPSVCLASPATELAPAANRRRLGGQRRRSQPVAEAGSARRPACPIPSSTCRRAPPVVSEQLACLPDRRRRGPEAYGFRGHVWTLKRVAEVTCMAFGVVYHPTHVGRLAKVLRWSSHRPMRRARQHDEAVIARWRIET
jgi:hypothetical protein